MELSEYEIELIESAFATFDDKSTEFILSVATEEVAESLNIDIDDANDLVIDYLYKKSKNEAV